jgi:hypothetical protein
MTVKPVSGGTAEAGTRYLLLAAEARLAAHEGVEERCNATPLERSERGRAATTPTE